MRNACVQEFFSVRLISHTFVELQRMRLGFQYEIVDAGEVRICLDSPDQRPTKAYSSPRGDNGDASDFGGGPIFFQDCPRRADGSAVFLHEKVKRGAVIFVALHIDRDALFDDENFFPDPEAFASFILALDYFDFDHIRKKPSAGRS